MRHVFLLLLATLGLGCGSSFSSAAPDGAPPGDGPEKDVRPSDGGSSGDVADVMSQPESGPPPPPPAEGGRPEGGGIGMGDGAPTTFGCGKYSCTIDAQYCLKEGSLPSVGICDPTPPGCKKDLDSTKRCACLLASVEDGGIGTDLNCSCTGKDGRYVVTCIPKIH